MKHEVTLTVFVYNLTLASSDKKRGAVQIP